jgi:hypothetical protein
MKESLLLVSVFIVSLSVVHCSSAAIAALAIIAAVAASAGRLAAGNHTVDKRKGAAYPFLHVQRTGRAIAHARPAFHALVPIGDKRFFIVDNEDCMRADLGACAASRTFLRS